MAQCASLIAPYGLIASPAGLTTQVGFIRLAHLKCPKSGKPDFGWSIILRKKLLRRRWIAGSSPAMTRLSMHGAMRFADCALRADRVTPRLQPNSGLPEF